VTIRRGQDGAIDPVGVAESGCLDRELV